MTQRQQETSESGLDRLRDELTDYLTARVGDLAERASDKLFDVTDQLTDVAKNGGPLSQVGAGLLGGDSPVKAALSGTVKGVKNKLLDKVKGSSGGSGNGPGDRKVTNMVEVIDVGVPLRTAYDHWTQYERFSEFAKGVRSVSTSDETTSDWKVKVGPSTRGWKATIREQVPDERIVWNSEGSKGSTRGVVSFHELAPGLTRIVLVVEYYASGLFEKTGNLWRAQGRRLRLDLKHFQRYVSLTDKEPKGWRGEIRDGEVVRTHEEVVEDEEAQDEEAPEDEEESDEEESGETDEEAEENEEEDEEDGEDEPDEGPEGDEEWEEDDSEEAEEEEK
ncbi:SRPBCC family protein [Streptomyces sp. NPDC015350]|uniref:SRPBCC family protein n=1 Tax=Streptomyces sp. NPDC015350 TaxID=3364955 RepID=UPI003702CB12